MSYAEAGELMGVDTETVRTLVNQGLLKSVQIGRQRRIAIGEVTQFLADVSASE
jgi:excisionase family DNA binding protein